MNEMISDEAFLELIRTFLTFAITPDFFCDNFTDLWIQRRDATHSRQTSWPERYDLQLKQQLEEGRLSIEEFGKQWYALWGIADNICFYEMIDAIHSACSVFYPAPRLAGEIDEAGLRADVAKILAEFEKCKQTTSE